MSLDDKDRLDLIQYRLDEAKDTQTDVELLISHDRLRAAINRIYYGMFLCIVGIGIKISV